MKFRGRWKMLCQQRKECKGKAQGYKGKNWSPNSLKREGEARHPCWSLTPYKKTWSTIISPILRSYGVVLKFLCFSSNYTLFLCFLNNWCCAFVWVTFWTKEDHHSIHSWEDMQETTLQALVCTIVRWKGEKTPKNSMFSLLFHLDTTRLTNLGRIHFGRV